MKIPLDIIFAARLDNAIIWVTSGVFDNETNEVIIGDHVIIVRVENDNK